MIVRIVKMTFSEDKVDSFILNFDLNKEKIRNFEGCHKLELLRGEKMPNIFFTYSWWDDDSALNKYRNSELFAGVWETTKTFFSDKPEAWSLKNIRAL